MDMHDRDAHALVHQSVGGFQTEQTATDDNGMFETLAGIEHAIDVMNIAERDHTGQVITRERDDEGRGACGDQQAVIGFFGAIVTDDLALTAIDPGNGLAFV